MASKPETALRNKMVKAIRALPCPTRVRVVHGGPHQSAGEPDLDAVICGTPVKIEVKMPGNEPTPKQASVIRQWRNAGAIADWADSMERLEQILYAALSRPAYGFEPDAVNALAKLPVALGLGKTR